MNGASRRPLPGDGGPGAAPQRAGGGGRGAAAPAVLPAPRAEGTGRAAAGRLAAVAGVVLLHLGLYYLVNRTNAARSASALWNLWTPLDGLVPHLPRTWPLYWALYPYLTVGAVAVVWSLPGRSFRRALAAYAVASLVGAAVQLAVPAKAPWPPGSDGPQAFLHASPWVLPYACFPSMHVAFSVLTAALAVAVFRSRFAKVLYVAVAAAITLSTLTLREHYVLDAAGGVALGLAAAAWWRRDPRGAGRATRSVPLLEESP